VIAIVDYGVNNLASVRNAFRAAGADVEVTADPCRIEQAGGVVLPGIGAASAGMEQIRRRRLEDPLRRSVESGKPLLGLCLGMQLLFDRSEEGGEVPCLGIVPGTVRLLRGAPKIPQIGWNQVETRTKTPLWPGLPGNPYFYFVHSYVCVPAHPDVIAGETEYGERFCSALAHGAVWATQFHPERSGKTGLRLIANFVESCGK
jgi:glutamine amidotransferase